MNRQQLLDLVAGAFWGAAGIGLVLLVTTSVELLAVVPWIVGSMAALLVALPFLIAVVRGPDRVRSSRGAFASAGAVVGSALALALNLGLLPERPRPRPFTTGSSAGLASSVTPPAASSSSGDPHAAGSLEDLRERIRRDTNDAEGDPGSQEALLRLGRVHWFAGRPGEALDAWTRAAAAGPLPPEVLMTAVEVALLDLGDEGLARSWIDRLREAHPDEPRLASLERPVAELSGRSGRGT
jgi:hypothetical protein